MWEVVFTKRACKLLDKLPESVQLRIFRLVSDLKIGGPVRGNWLNYSKLNSDTHHCHIKKGNPTYVACWRVYKNEIRIEVYYVGTHEKAPY